MLPKPMTDGELAALCDGQISDAKQYDRTDLADGRAKAIDYLAGNVDVPHEKGKSSVTSNDLSDVMGWIMPGMLRVFLASDKVVVYEPKRPIIEPVPAKDEQGNPRLDPQTGQPVMSKQDVSKQRADQATDYVNHVFLNDCAGYQVLHSTLYDALALANGVIKHWWDPTPEYSTEEFSGLSEEVFNQLVSDPSVEEVLEHSAYPVPMPGQPPREEGPDALAVEKDGRGIGSDPLALDKIPNHRPEHIAEPGEPEEAGEPPPEFMGDEPPPMAPGMPGGPGAGQPGMPGVMPPPMLHDCKIKRCTNNGRLRVMAMPPEEFLIHRHAKRLDEDTIACGHFYQETRSNLIKTGYDPEVIDDLPSAAAITEPMSINRDSKITPGSNADSTKDKSTELVDVYEWYPLVDFDGDGVAERRRVIMGGLPSERTILENEEWGDDLPFTDLVPDPVPHRWRGRSLFDEVKDVQRIKTALFRQTLDNLYQTNSPQKEVMEGSVINMDALVNQELGANIFVKQSGAINILSVPFIAKESFAMLEYCDQIIEKRTGVSRTTMALDLNVLQNQTATATNAAQAAAATKVETYARNMAEAGLKRLFRCLLKLIVKHQDKERTIRLRGQWVEMDPRAWDADMDVAINTGLGSGSKERDLAMLQAVAAKQEQILQLMGQDNPLVPLDAYRNTLAKMVEVGGLKNPEQFFSEITDAVKQQMAAKAAQPAPDPKAQEAQARIQIESQKAQSDVQLAQAKAQADAQQKQQEAAFRAQHDREKASLDLQLARDKAGAEMQLQRERNAAEIEHLREKAVQEYALKREELALEAQLKREQMHIQATMASATNIQEATPQ